MNIWIIIGLLLLFVIPLFNILGALLLLYGLYKWKGWIAVMIGIPVLVIVAIIMGFAWFNHVASTVAGWIV